MLSAVQMMTDTVYRAPSASNSKNAVAAWLCLCALMVALMVLLGGYTRLSGSGLSIVEWKPVHGMIPPLSTLEWEEEFALYRASPEFLYKNHWMALADFQRIFWVEYAHRLLGRLAGLVFLLPLTWFWATGALNRREGLPLLGIFALGGLQGAAGWFMVKSGLTQDPQVSHYRLALHLGMAFLIFGLLLWQILNRVRLWQTLEQISRAPVLLSSLRKQGSYGCDSTIPAYAGMTKIDKLEPNPQPLPSQIIRLFQLLFILLCIQIFYGGLMAGLKAGWVYNTFPTMDGRWLPEGLLAAPFPAMLFEHIPMVQFCHRVMAFLLVIGLPLWWLSVRRHAINNRLKTTILLMLMTLAAQFILGIVTLLGQVPLIPALLHQMTALVLFGLGVAVLHGLRHGERT